MTTDASPAASIIERLSNLTQPDVSDVADEVSQLETLLEDATTAVRAWGEAGMEFDVAEGDKDRKSAWKDVVASGDALAAELQALLEAIS
jgi:hypothetical protein